MFLKYTMADVDGAVIAVRFRPDAPPSIWGMCEVFGYSKDSSLMECIVEQLFKHKPLDISPYGRNRIRYRFRVRSVDFSKRLRDGDDVGLVFKQVHTFGRLVR